jgi:hypothetical protein
MSFPLLLQSCYFGPIHYYSYIVSANKLTIEQHDHYSRQTYRNRMLILAANGPMALTIPVIKPGIKTITKDIRISYDTAWQKMHWRSLVSAYNGSPFFEYYQDDIQPIYEKKWDFLMDLNNHALQCTTNLLELHLPLCYTSDYDAEIAPDCLDIRHVIHPKRKGPDTEPPFSPQPYRQVFSDKYGFIPNLSIVDLLFNKGPEAYTILEESLVPR